MSRVRASAEKPKLPENFEADTWAKLQAAVRAVHAKESVAFSYEQLYRARAPRRPPRAPPPPPPKLGVDKRAGAPPPRPRRPPQGCEDLVLHKMGAGLYAKLLAEVDAHVGAQLTLLAVRCESLAPRAAAR